MRMPIVVGISFKEAGRIYYFDPGELRLAEGDYVLAETSKGVELGEVVMESRWAEPEEIVEPLKKVIRKATAGDLEKGQENKQKERRAFELCAKRIEERGLPMKLVDAELTFDRSKITFNFTSEGRVDFRALAREMGGRLKTRVEFHKIGVRDEAKRVGGAGPCGRELCCATFLTDFESVAVKMAREQGLALNPLKISGICGRLMCCLKYEYELYKGLKERLPKVGTEVETYAGKGKVVDLNVLRGLVVVAIPELGELKFPVEEVKVYGGGGQGDSGNERTEGNEGTKGN